MVGVIAHGNGFCFKLREEGAVWRIGFLMLLFFQEVQSEKSSVCLSDEVNGARVRMPRKQDDKLDEICYQGGVVKKKNFDF